jgi:light-regulated signal transduction histidine kinase (bacteriophytochrome)
MTLNTSSKKITKDTRLEQIINLILSFAQGDLDQRIEISGKEDELEAIALGLNMLGEELSYSKKELAARENKLKETLQEVQNANKELEHFAYMVSHDLQEPLRMISSFLKLLQSETEGQLDEDSKQYMRFAIDGAERMKILINDLLEYSRIGTNTENFAVTDLNEVVKSVLQVLQEKIDEKAAIITVQPLPSVPVIRSLITQLFLNLVSNALKYHENKNVQIEIGNTEETGRWVFYVKDNGIGIDFQHFEKIFAMFQRLHISGRYKGTGIGLAICKKVVHAHHGDIWVESEVGKGSTFYFSIPKKHK